MTECTCEEWLAFIFQYTCYHTEGNKKFSSDESRPLVTKHIFGYDWKGNIIPGDVLGMVRYHDNIHRTYYIHKTTTAPTTAQEIIKRKKK